MLIYIFSYCMLCKRLLPLILVLFCLTPFCIFIPYTILAKYMFVYIFHFISKFYLQSISANNNGDMILKVRSEMAMVSVSFKDLLTANWSKHFLFS